MKEFHPAADIFPLMQEQEFSAFIDDIRANGLRLPILLHPDGRILDGRNRYRACSKLGIAPRFETVEKTDTLVLLLLSLNLHRRHLTSDQRACCAVELLPWLEKEAEAERRKKIGSARRGETDQKIDSSQKNKRMAAQKAAELLKTNRQYVSDAKNLRSKDPKAFRKVKSGDASLMHVKRQKKEAERESRRDQNRQVVQATESLTDLVGKAHFSTIVVDPPWAFSDEGDVDPSGARPTYQTHSIEEIKTMTGPGGDIPIETLADEDCHLYLWITNRSLPKGFALLEEWGFRYVTCLTWCKPSIGMGSYFRGSTEQILFGVRGSQPLLRKDVGTWFSAKRPGPHSAKSDGFFSLVESCSPGPLGACLGGRSRSVCCAFGLLAGLVRSKSLRAD